MLCHDCLLVRYRFNSLKLCQLVHTGPHSKARKPIFTFQGRPPSNRIVPRVPRIPRFRPVVDVSRPIEEIIVPIDVEPAKGQNVEFPGVENVKQRSIVEILEKFCQKEVIRELAEVHGLTGILFNQAFKSFRSYCLNSQPLEPELKVLFSDIVKQGHSVDQLFVYFLAHARKVYPHLDCIQELKSLSNLTQPHNWYPLARTINRRVIFHAGPTNSGKTYEALQAFKAAKSGVCCGPLRLLAMEVFQKMNAAGILCDLMTGDDRQYAKDEMNPVDHLACTVEMLSTEMRVDLVLIDEIQMLRDPQRGSAWTRALLGAPADEIHLCGELSAVPIVKNLLKPIGESVEVREYKRKSELVISTHSLKSLKSVRPGDCIIVFSKKDIFATLRQLKALGISSAFIYGDLPASTKRIQTDKFNNPNDPTKVLVSTDAIGMGLNLNIRRIIFQELTKPPDFEILTTPHLKQIAGRAGRFGMNCTKGEVMTMKEDDMWLLRGKMAEPIEDIRQAGIAPGFEQIEMFLHHLPKASFANVLEIFRSLSTISGNFFMSEGYDNMIQIAKMLEKFYIPLRPRYYFCIAPINITNPSRISSRKADFLLRVAERYASGEPITVKFMHELIGWPKKAGLQEEELTELELCYEFCETYLWWSYRFQDVFIDTEAIRALQKELILLITITLQNIIGSSIDGQLVKEMKSEGIDPWLIMKLRAGAGKLQTVTTKRSKETNSAKLRAEKPSKPVLEVIKEPKEINDTKLRAEKIAGPVHEVAQEKPEEMNSVKLRSEEPTGTAPWIITKKSNNAKMVATKMAIESGTDSKADTKLSNR